MVARRGCSAFTVRLASGERKRSSSIGTTEASENREHPPVTVGGGRQFELGEDVCDMGLDRQAQPSWSPAAPRTRGQRCHGPPASRAGQLVGSPPLARRARTRAFRLRCLRRPRHRQHWLRRQLRLLPVRVTRPMGRRHLPDVRRAGLRGLNARRLLPRHHGVRPSQGRQSRPGQPPVARSCSARSVDRIGCLE